MPAASSVIRKLRIMAHQFRTTGALSRPIGDQVLKEHIVLKMAGFPRRPPTCLGTSDRLKRGGVARNFKGEATDDLEIVAEPDPDRVEGRMKINRRTAGRGGADAGYRAGSGQWNRFGVLAQIGVAVLKP
jgi:hypothetical protein